MKKKTLLIGGSLALLLLAGCNTHQHTDNNTNEKSGKNISQVNASKENLKQQVVKNYINKDQMKALEQSLNGNKAKLSLVQQYGKEVKEICSNYPNMDTLLTKNKNKFKELIATYQGIIKGVPNATISKINSNLDQVLGTTCYKKWDMGNMERLAEQTRRGDFTTWKEKLQRTQKYWDLYVKKDIKKDNDYINNLKQNCNGGALCKKIDIDKFIKACTAVDSFNPFYNIMHNRYNWNKITGEGLWFKPKLLETQFIERLIKSFNTEVLPNIGLTKEEFKKRIQKEYGFKTTDELVKIIEKKFLQFKETVGLEKYIPINRKFTKKERKLIFKDKVTLMKELKGLLNNPDNRTKIKELRLLTYYLIYFDDTKKYWSSGYRAKNMSYGYGIQNLFRVSRYVDEPFKLSLKVQ